MQLCVIHPTWVKATFLFSKKKLHTYIHALLRGSIAAIEVATRAANNIDILLRKLPYATDRLLKAKYR